MDPKTVFLRSGDPHLKELFFAGSAAWKALARPLGAADIERVQFVLRYMNAEAHALGCSASCGSNAGAALIPCTAVACEGRPRFRYHIEDVRGMITEEREGRRGAPAGPRPPRARPRRELRTTVTAPLLASAAPASFLAASPHASAAPEGGARGRGRPPVLRPVVAGAPAVPGRGRGRPPTAAAPLREDGSPSPPSRYPALPECSAVPVQVAVGADGRGIVLAPYQVGTRSSRKRPRGVSLYDLRRRVKNVLGDYKDGGVFGVGSYAAPTGVEGGVVVLQVGVGHVPGLDPGLAAFIGAIALSKNKLSVPLLRALGFAAAGVDAAQGSGGAASASAAPLAASGTAFSGAGGSAAAVASALLAPLGFSATAACAVSAPEALGGAASSPGLSGAMDGPLAALHGAKLRNSGSTCFLNSVLQLLSHLPYFFRSLDMHQRACRSKRIPGLGSPECINCALFDFIRDSLLHSGTMVILPPFVSVLQLLGLGVGQHDAAECLCMLLNLLSGPDCTISSMFGDAQWAGGAPRLDSSALVLFDQLYSNLGFGYPASSTMPALVQEAHRLSSLTEAGIYAGAFGGSLASAMDTEDTADMGGGSDAGGASAATAGGSSSSSSAAAAVPAASVAAVPAAAAAVPAASSSSGSASSGSASSSSSSASSSSAAAGVLVVEDDDEISPPFSICALSRGDLPFRLSLGKQITCPKGHFTSTAVNQYPILELPLLPKEGQSLDSLLRAYIRPVVLGDEDWICNACNQRMPGTSADSIVGLPPVLLIQFKRFVHMGYGQLTFTVKTSSAVSFDSVIDMGPYVTLTPQQVEAALNAGGRPRRDSDGAELVGTVELLYDLRSFIPHQGSSAESGHYTCTGRGVTKGELLGDEVILAPGSEHFFVLNDSIAPSLPKMFPDLAKDSAYILAFEARNLKVVASIADSAVYTQPSPNPPRIKPLRKPRGLRAPSPSAPPQPSPPIPGLPEAAARAKVMQPLTAQQEEAVKFVLGEPTGPHLQTVRILPSKRLPSGPSVAQIREQLLASKGWLATSVIDAFLKLLAVRGKTALASAIAAGAANGFLSAAPHGQAGLFLPFESSFFLMLMGNKSGARYSDEKFDFDAVKSWTKPSKHFPPIDIFLFRWLLIPVNVKNMNKHWAGVVVDNVNLTAAYFDSGLDVDVEFRTGCTSNVIQYLSHEWLSRKGESILFPGYRSTAAPVDLPKQSNGFDCGAFLLATAECLSRGVVPSTTIFAQENMPFFRRKFAATLIWGHSL